MNKHRPRKPFRYEYIPGKYSGLTEEERQWRVWEEMDQEDAGYEELVWRLEESKTDKGNADVKRAVPP